MLCCCEDLKGGNDVYETRPVLWELWEPTFSRRDSVRSVWNAVWSL
jgi:hypothetical protein